MKIRKIEVGLGINLKVDNDFSMIKPSINLEAEIEEGESLEEAHNIIMKKAKWLLLREVILLSGGKNSVVEKCKEDMLGYLKDYFSKFPELPE